MVIDTQAGAQMLSAAAMPQQGPLLAPPNPETQAPPGALALAAPPAAPPAPPSGPPSGGASIGAQLKAKNSPYLNSLTSALNSVATTNPAAVAQTGGWAKTLVAAGAHALSGLSTALGDASAVGTVPSG